MFDKLLWIGIGFSGAFILMGLSRLTPNSRGRGRHSSSDRRLISHENTAPDSSAERPRFWSQVSHKRRGSNPPPPNSKPTPPLGPEFYEGIVQRGNGHGGPNIEKPKIVPCPSQIVKCKGPCEKFGPFWCDCNGNITRYKS
jgi:hypothetical protein